MRSIVCINTNIPTIENEFDLGTEGSLRDYDIVIFCPKIPYYSRIDFSAGGSCISIEGTAEFIKASAHWASELRGALHAGKNIFIPLSTYKEDNGAVSSSTGTRNSRNYNTAKVNNYSPLPNIIRVKNAHGRGIIVKDPAYRGLYEAISEIAEYRVVLEVPSPFQATFAAKDGTAIGGVVRVQGETGCLVLLPYFDFTADDCAEYSEEEEENIWSQKALKTSHALVGQIVAIDRMLRGSVEQTPPPDWIDEFQRPKVVDEIDGSIAEIDARIEELGQQREREALRRADLLEYSHLLYESGKPLERAIEKVLRLIGYTVETLRLGDLEIDHVIVGPSGTRMIGESEGKDTSAIDISKFRQLESNIGEDFERDEIDQPAKGLLFGNGFRLSAPGSRSEQFTLKSLTNARRLGSALIRTVDLYPVALHLIDRPEDDAFRNACQAAIEGTAGGIVVFPTP